MSKQTTKKDKVCILTDFDKKGKQLYFSIKSYCSENGIRLSVDKAWNYIGNACMQAGVDPACITQSELREFRSRPYMTDIMKSYGL